MAVRKDIPIHAIWLAQDDPKKNTAVNYPKEEHYAFMRDLQNYHARNYS